MFGGSPNECIPKRQKMFTRQSHRQIKTIWCSGYHRKQLLPIFDLLESLRQWHFAFAGGGGKELTQHLQR